MKYIKEIQKYEFGNKLVNLNKIKRLIEIIYNTYNIYPNNYNNSINMLNILGNYNKIMNIKLKKKILIIK